MHKYHPVVYMRLLIGLSTFSHGIYEKNLCVCVFTEKSLRDLLQTGQNQKLQNKATNVLFYINIILVKLCKKYNGTTLAEFQERCPPELSRNLSTRVQWKCLTYGILVRKHTSKSQGKLWPKGTSVCYVLQGLDTGETMSLAGAWCQRKLKELSPGVAACLQEQDAGERVHCCKSLPDEHTRTRKPSFLLLQYLQHTLY